MVIGASVIAFSRASVGLRMPLVLDGGLMAKQKRPSGAQTGADVLGGLLLIKTGFWR